MIPLGYFLIAWIVLLGVHAIFTIFTVMQILKHGTPNFATYFSTFMFIIVTTLTVLASGTYFLTIDWNQRIQPLPGIIMQTIDTEGNGYEIDLPLE